MNILSLNGGGTSGYMTASILERIEQATGYLSYELFDLTCGVSTGSILAGLISKGVPASETVKFYRKEGKHIFKKRNVIKFWKPFYNIDTLKKLVEREIPDTFGSPLKCRLMIYATKVDTPHIEPFFWKSWDLNVNDIKISEAIISSCAAPAYFAPVNTSYGTFIDGGLVSNNPSMCSISEAIRLGASFESIYNVNIACGQRPGFEGAHHINTIWEWLPKLPTVFLFGNERSVEYQSHSLLGFNNHVVKPKQAFPVDSLDFNKMDDIVNTMWKEHGSNLITRLTPV